MPVYLNDCLEELKKIDSNTIDMVYLDPPFFTQKKHTLKNQEGKEYSFDDCWGSISEYMVFLRKRLEECKRVLKRSGNLFFHCDSTASAYIKVMLDDLFGVENFRSEIIWTYKRWSNSQNGLLPSHQTILYYSKSKNYKFNKIYTSYSVTTNIDQILQERIRDERGKVVYKTDEDGVPVQCKEKKGVPLSDVWEIPLLNPKAKERVGYPTQKPILLLERIIEISTDENDIILDPFCGSGTTLVAAKLLHREFIGIDISCDAVEVSKARIACPIKTRSQLLEIGEDAYDTKKEFEKFILKSFDCDIVQRNSGIDAILKRKYDNGIVAIKIQRDNESLPAAVKKLQTSGEKKKCSFTILIKTSSKSKSHINVPENMLILDSYELMWDAFVKQQGLQIT